MIDHGYKPTYHTGDIWCATHLLCMGIRLLRTDVGPHGKAEWHFDNTNDLAWRTGLEYRDRVAVAPITDVKENYRLLARLAQQAYEGRKNEQHDNN